MAVGNPRRRDWLTLAGAAAGLARPAGLAANYGRDDARTRAADAGARAACGAGAGTSGSTSPAAAAMAERRDLLHRLKALGPAFAAHADQRGVLQGLPTTGVRSRAYFGLTPSPWQSGGIDREQGISKAGNPRARHAAIELAWLWLRHQPDSALSRWFSTRTADASKRIRRIAIVALARKLIVALWRYLTTGLVPEERCSSHEGLTPTRNASAPRLRRGQRRMDDDRATLGPTNSRFVDGSHPHWLPRRMHAECGYGPTSDRI